LAGTLATAGVLLSGCSLADLPRFGWPQGVTPQGERMQYFWSASFIAALIVGIGMWGLMFWAFFVYHKRTGSPLYPKQTKENLPLELVYTAVPLVLVGILFYFTVTTEDYVLDKSARADVTIDVTAFKWNWDFGYEGTQVAGGLVHTVGSSEEIPLLVLPANRLIEYRLQSKDVIHSFWVPDFLFKRDVFPDPKKNNSENVFQNTIERTGSFVGRCAELCGTYHSAMNFEVRALPGDVYDAYIGLRQQVYTATGKPYTAAEALTELQKKFPDCEHHLPVQHGPASQVRDASTGR
jgi:cytochrome c oxidase subunit 2